MGSQGVFGLPGFKGHVPPCAPTEAVRVGRVPTHIHQVRGKWWQKGSPVEARP